MIIIGSKRKKLENIFKKNPGAIIAYVTSQAKDGLVRLSPFYPHGDIPVIIAIFRTHHHFCLTINLGANKIIQLIPIQTQCTPDKSSDDWFTYNNSTIKV